MSRFISFLNLAYRFNVHLLKKPFVSGTKGKDKFIDNYRDDHIFPLTEEIRRRLPQFSTCIGCGLCDTVCSKLAASHLHINSGPSELASCLSRSLPDYHLLDEYLRLWKLCGDCQECLAICPADLPLRDLAAFSAALVKLAQTTRDE